ncbi:MAG: hypothetical protein U0556_16040 [Dehalococcoidia bacterium]
MTDTRVIGRIQAVTVVTPDLDASLQFYQEGLGYSLLDRGTLDAEGAPQVEGESLGGRAWALVNAPGAVDGAVRLLTAPANALPNRPRPDAKPWDPGLAVLELYMRDPQESFRHVQAVGAPVLSPPLPYRFVNAGPFGDIDVISYAAFGPAGEELFITRATGGSRERPTLEGTHSGIFNIVLPNLDRRPVLRFYELLLGLVPTVSLPIAQETSNQIIGAPFGTTFLMILLGPEGGATGVEVEEFDVAHGHMYPTSLNRTGLALFTLRVRDLDEIRSLCNDYKIARVGDGALPLPGRLGGNGLIVRGALGELVELVD